MELINTGLRLDTSSPLEAIESYQRGGDLLSRVLESARGAPIAFPHPPYPPRFYSNDPSILDTFKGTPETIAM